MIKEIYRKKGKTRRRMIKVNRYSKGLPMPPEAKRAWQAVESQGLNGLSIENDLPIQYKPLLFAAEDKEENGVTYFWFVAERFLLQPIPGIPRISQVYLCVERDIRGNDNFLLGSVKPLTFYIEKKREVR